MNITTITYGELSTSCETLANQIEGHVWDNMDAAQQRDWLFSVAVPQLQSLKDAVWPGKGTWKPTEEQPQQDFFEAFAESLHSFEKEARTLRDAMARILLFTTGVPHSALGDSVNRANEIARQTLDAIARQENEALIAEINAGDQQASEEKP